MGDKKITNIREIIQVLEQSAKIGKSLLIISEDLEGEALATLVLNSIRGTIKICAIKTPGFGEKKKEYLEDIAILTGATIISENYGNDLQEEIEISKLGEAKKIIVNKDSTTLINGKGNKEEIEERINELNE